MSFSDPALLVDFDILLTDSLIRLSYHLVFGKVDPEDHHPHWNLAVEIDDDALESLFAGRQCSRRRSNIWY